MEANSAKARVGVQGSDRDARKDAAEPIRAEKPAAVRETSAPDHREGRRLISGAEEVGAVSVGQREFGQAATDSSSAHPVAKLTIGQSLPGRVEFESGEQGGSVPPAQTERVLIPAFDGMGPDGIRRDSLGRVLDDKSIAAAVGADADVQRERNDRLIYIQTAYRDPKAATQHLDEIIARDGSTSAAQRLASDPSVIGELRGREGFFAGARARDEREAATMAAAAIGPNIVRTAELESRTANAYRVEIEKQMKADATPIPDVSERTREALRAVAAAKTDAKGAEAFRLCCPIRKLPAN